MKHYWLCGKCAIKKGGIFPKGHVCTAIQGQCLYCKKKEVTLIPWVDFNWPKNNKKNIRAKINRD